MIKMKTHQMAIHHVSTSIFNRAVLEELQMQTVVSRRGYLTPLLNMVVEILKVTWNGHETGPELDGHQVNWLTQVAKTTLYLLIWCQKMQPVQSNRQVL